MCRERYRKMSKISGIDHMLAVFILLFKGALSRKAGTVAKIIEGDCEGHSPILGTSLRTRAKSNPDKTIFGERQTDLAVSAIAS
jgi:hypothetical protein